MKFGGIFDIDAKQLRLQTIKDELALPDSWTQPEKTQQLGKERAQIEDTVEAMVALLKKLQDTLQLYELADSENDTDMLNSILQEAEDLTKEIENLEFRRMFSGEMDGNAAYMDIQSGSGGTEAQDWAEMLLRMYLRWGERHGFTVELLECSPGDVAGIKSA